jgi:hypothetical protein
MPRIPHEFQSRNRLAARLTHGLKGDTVLWLLHGSVLRETPMAFSCDYFKKLNGYSKPSFYGEKEPCQGIGP